MDKAKKLWSFWAFLQDIFGSPALFITIVGAGGVVMMIWGVLYTWAQNLKLPQLILFAISTFCFLLVFIRLVIDRWQKHSIERIPDLIEKLDVLTSNYIDDFNVELTPDGWKNLNRDYGNILGLDLTRLETEIQKEHNLPAIERAFESINNTYNKKLNPQNKTAESLTYLGDMGSILDTYNAGLNRLKVTPQYIKLDKTIKSLQRRAPSAFISVKVNEYYTVSERLYIMLLGVKPLYDRPILRERIPAKIYAKKSQIKPIVEGQIANLIAGVRESIIKYKERNKGQPSEQNTVKSENRPEIKRR